MAGRIVDCGLVLDIAFLRTLPSHSNTRGNIVNVLLDMCRDVVCLTGDVLMTRAVLPEIEISEEEILCLTHGCIELYPLTSR